MPTDYKILGQIAPTAAGTSVLYTVPTGSTAVLSTIAVTNRQASVGTYSIWVGRAGAAVAASNQFAASVVIAPNDTVGLTLGVSMSASDVVRVQPSSACITFHAFGAEIS
jgi:D-serine deaminase-like pyridoxal phosphate-dependent protein